MESVHTEQHHSVVLCGSRKVYAISQLANKFHGNFAAPREYIISLIL